MNPAIFKKGLIKDIAKYFPSLTPHTESMLVGQFTLRDLTQEYVLVLLVKEETKIKMCLASNRDACFESILASMKFIVGA